MIFWRRPLKNIKTNYYPARRHLKYIEKILIMAAVKHDRKQSSLLKFGFEKASPTLLLSLCLRLAPSLGHF